MKISRSIAKSYDKLADEYTREAYTNHLALSQLKRFANLLPKNAKVLDVGCGGGQDAKFLSDQGYAVLGIDVSKEMIKRAKIYAPKATFQKIDIRKLQGESYDGIWCCRVFHHISLDDQSGFLDALNKNLSIGGILYLTSVVSDKNSDYEAFDSGNDHLLKKRLRPATFKKIIADHGFKILRFSFWSEKKGMEVICKKEF